MSYINTKPGHLCNPCTYSTGTSNKDGYKSFTYEGGTTLYHFCPCDCDIFLQGAKNVVWLNVVFFADSPEHAADVFERMLNFRMWAAKKEYGDLEITNSYIRAARELLTLKDKWVFNLAPVNQFYKVGWAFNDSVLG